MTSFVVFSSLGFYPVTPRSANFVQYRFAAVRACFGETQHGNTFEIVANRASDTNKYIQSARLSGQHRISRGSATRM